MAFWLWFHYQYLLTWLLNNCLLITRCEIEVYSDDWLMHQCSYINCMCVHMSTCLQYVYLCTWQLRCDTADHQWPWALLASDTQKCVLVSLCRDLLWVINQPEQLGYCWVKERALSSDSSPDTCGFQYDTYIRKAWSNKQCVKFPLCLYQSIKKKERKKMELNFQQPPSPPAPPQALSSRAGISLESELAISTCFNLIKYC